VAAEPIQIGLSPEGRREHPRALRAARAARVYRRLKVVPLVAVGHPLREAARLSDVGRTSVYCFQRVSAWRHDSRAYPSAVKSARRDGAPPAPGGAAPARRGAARRRRGGGRGQPPARSRPSVPPMGAIGPLRSARGRLALSACAPARLRAESGPAGVACTTPCGFGRAERATRAVGESPLDAGPAAPAPPDGDALVDRLAIGAAVLFRRPRGRAPVQADRAHPDVGVPAQLPREATTA
jgi:hypothetical protein